MRIALAFRAFFAVLFRPDAAARIGRALESEAVETPKNASKVKQETGPSSGPHAGPVAVPALRSDAVTLLSVLQRDARLLDLVNESLDPYSDEQIGSAARNVLKDTRKSLDRMFDIQPIVPQSEGERVELPEKGSPIRWRILGDADARSGTLTHAGWIANRMELPKWTGNREDAMVLAPVEVETRPQQ